MSDLGYGEDKPVAPPVIPPEFRQPTVLPGGPPYGPPATAPYAAPPSAPYGQPAYGQPAYVQPVPGGIAPFGGPALPPGTPAPRPRRRWVLPVVIVGALLVVAVAVTTVVTVMRSGDPTASPEAAVRGFYGDLSHGQAAHAVASLATKPDGDDAMLTDAAFRSGDAGIGSVRIGAVTRHGTTATVVATVRARAGTSTIPVVVREVRGGWHVDPQVMGRVSLVSALPSGSTVEFDGRRLDTRTSFPVLPGSYRFATKVGDDWVDEETQTVAVGIVAGGDTAQLRFLSPLTAAGESAAGAAVDGFIDACLTQTTLHTSGGCGFGLGAQDNTTYTDIRWTATTRPVPDFGGWNGHGWAVSASRLGEFHVEATYHEGYDSGTATGDFTDAPLGGVVSVSSSGTWTYASSLPDVT